MNHKPRFRLRTLFVIFFCAAVGLATDRNSIHALQPAIATAMILGLLQQIRELTQWRLLSGDGWTDHAFARRFAIGWRASIAAVMVTYCMTDLLGANAMLSFPKRDDLLLVEAFSTLNELCMIVVISSSIARWQSAIPESKPSCSKPFVFVLLAIVMTLFVVADGSCVEYLVHKAMAGIEAAITPRFQRPDVYPNHAAEGFHSFWLALAAASSVVVGTALLLMASKQGSSRAMKRFFIATCVACLLAQLLYCRWFYTIEFHRISPDFAGVGLAANWADRLGATAIALILVTTGAYRLSLSRDEAETISANLAEDLDRTALYETVPCLVIMAIAAGTALVTCAVELTSFIIFPVPWMQSWQYPGIFCNPTVLLILAEAALVFQLCWIRWRRRGEEVRWEMPALPVRVFAVNWIALVLAIIIGVPTLKAFGFLFWLGPFNYTGI
jgi:hypothetical protein